MTSWAFSLFIGMLTVKEKCHNFNCKVVKVFKQPCQLNFDGTHASLLGIAMPVKQYMWGPLEGWDGNNGVQEVTVFFKNKRIYKAYVSQYSTREDYDRWTCEFPNKRACFDSLTPQ